MKHCTCQAVVTPGQTGKAASERPKECLLSEAVDASLANEVAVSTVERRQEGEGRRSSGKVASYWPAGGVPFTHPLLATLKVNKRKRTHPPGD